MSGLVIIGVDPGATTGLCVLHPQRSPDLAQCGPAGVAPTLSLLFGAEPALIAVERFVVGPRAARSGTARAGQTARQLIGWIVEQAGVLGIRVVQRCAAEVKPWATDRRLDAAGLLEPTRGLPHARDAARHALFAAVRDAGLPDPLSAHHRFPR